MMMTEVQGWITMPGIVYGTMLVLFLSTVMLFKLSNSSQRRFPPGPRPWPVVGNFPLLLKRGVLPNRTMAELSRKYGPLVFLRLGSVPAVVVSSPKMAQLFLKNHDHVFASRAVVLQTTMLSYNNMTLPSLQYGDEWRFSRKIWMTELLSAKRLAGFQDLRMRQKVAFLHSILEESQGQKPIAMGLKFAFLSTNIITQMLARLDGCYMGQQEAEAGKRAAEFQKNVKEIARLSGVFYLGDYIPLFKPFDLQGYKPAMKAAHLKFDSFFQLLIDEHRQHLAEGNKLEDPDLLDILLTLPSDKRNKGMTDFQIKSHIFAMILGGTDTTTGSMEWGLAELLRHPRVMKKAQSEIDFVLGKERLVEETDLPKLPYLHAIVKEVFRLHPSLPLLVPRESMEDCNVEGFFIPKKSKIFINVYAIARDPEIWDKAEEFFPERFMEGGNSMALDFHGFHYEFLPFGSGRRTCVGKHLGIMSVEHTLALILQCFDWHLPMGMSPEDIDISEAFGLTLPMAVPVQAIPTLRVPISIIQKT